MSQHDFQSAQFRPAQSLSYLAGCFNFRDVGGRPTKLGSAIRSNRLFRSDAPHAVTPEDVRRLELLNISTVIDLRNESEGSHRFTDYIQQATAYLLPMFDATRENEDFARWGEPEIVARRYREILADATESISDTLAIMTDPASYPLIVHCTAGKDRTGIVTAVVQSLLGVSNREIVDDYARSQAAMPALVAWMHRTYPGADEYLQRSASAMLMAPPRVMELFLATLKAEFGSVEAYVASIGMESSIGYIRAALLQQRVSIAA